MKRFYLILFLLLPLFCAAQNYQCLQPGVKSYFTNKSGYLRGIRIDSTKSYPDSIVYYPFHTPRGRYAVNPVLDSTSGSWLGKRVLQLNDGTFLFDNIRHDTVMIKTGAKPGETWVFYSDTTRLYYQAEVLSIDTITILGVIDSVKKILITARDPSGIVTTDPVDSFQVLLSKDHGFTKIFDLYTFPYHASDSGYMTGLDYYVDYLVDRYTLIPDWQFSLTDLVIPTIKDLSQWNVGDIFEYSSCDDYFEHMGTSCSPVEHYIYDTISSVTTTSTDVTYTIGRLQLDRSRISTGSIYLDGPPFYEKSSSVQTKNFNLDPVFDLKLMPEENDQPFIYYYAPNDTTRCVKNTLYVSQYNNEIWHGGYHRIFEHFTGPLIYKAPFGLLDASSAGAGDGSTFIVYAQKLIYYNKGGIICGGNIYPPTKVNDQELQTEKFELYPNPVTDILTVSSTREMSRVDIVNLLGQTMFNKEIRAKELEINVSALPNGIYVVRVDNVNRKKFIKS